MSPQERVAAASFYLAMVQSGHLDEASEFFEWLLDHFDVEEEALLELLGMNDA